MTAVSAAPRSLGGSSGCAAGNAAEPERSAEEGCLALHGQRRGNREEGRRINTWSVMEDVDSRDDRVKRRISARRFRQWALRCKTHTHTRT